MAVTMLERHVDSLAWMREYLSFKIGPQQRAMTRYIEPCAQLLCSEVFPAYRKDVNASSLRITVDGLSSFEIVGYGTLGGTVQISLISEGGDLLCVEGPADPSSTMETELTFYDGSLRRLVSMVQAAVARVNRMSQKT